MGDGERDPSFWKFNSTLVNDSDYRFLLDENIKNWLEEFKQVVDKRVLWDLLKYKIQLFTIKYSKEKAHSRKAKDKDLEVIYQTRATVFHRDIQTPRRELKIRRAAEYF